jgi:hypothetical protein
MPYGFSFEYQKRHRGEVMSIIKAILAIFVLIVFFGEEEIAKNVPLE